MNSFIIKDILSTLRTNTVSNVLSMNQGKVAFEASFLFGFEKTKMARELRLLEALHSLMFLQTTEPFVLSPTLHTEIVRLAGVL